MQQELKKQEFNFQDKGKSENGVLGILEGPCADIIHPTRNGRKYSEKLWEKVFSSPIVNEMFQNGGIVGELDHPTDRSEICSQKIAILMPEKPKKGKDGLLHAIFKILDTPCGRIVHALAKAGFKVGVSSRGEGDTFVDSDGNEMVDESSYDFKCFDVVIVPSVKAARLNLVTESLDTSSRRLRENLDTAITRSNEQEKQLMLETLQHLKIDYSPNKVDNNTDNEKVNGNLEVINDESKIAKRLQESLLRNRELDKKVKQLQEKLSVCYTQGERTDKLLNKYRNSISVLTHKVRMIESQNSRLNRLSQKLSEKDDKIANLTEELNQSRLSFQDRINHAKKSSLHQSVEFEKQTNRLNEQLSEKNQEIRNLKNKIVQLKQQFNSMQNDFESETKTLSEDLGNTKQSLQVTKEQYAENIKQQKRLVQKYKSIANKAVDKYITIKANQLGVEFQDIKSKLIGNYSFKDIDTICENLRQYKLNVNKLPFNISKSKPEGVGKVKMKITEAKQPILGNSQFDDEVDGLLSSFVEG